MNKKIDIEDELNDLRAVPIMLSNMSRTYHLGKLTLSHAEEIVLLEAHIQIEDILNFAIKTIDRAVNNIQEAIKEEDSNESEATTETAKYQK